MKIKSTFCDLDIHGINKFVTTYNIPNPCQNNISLSYNIMT